VSGVGAPTPERYRCPSCGRSIRVCQQCHSHNRVLSAHCRGCGAKLIVEPQWPQHGYDSAGSHCPPLPGSPPVLIRAWTQTFSRPQEPQGDNATPSPIVVGDIIVIARHHEGCQAFEARHVETGDALWLCKLRQSNLGLVGSPVHSGPYAYFITANPNYIHRIALDSGKREVCAVRTGDEVLYELPGHLLPNCPPLLIDGSMCIITSTSAMLVSLDFATSGDGPVLPCVVAEHSRNCQWTRPVQIGDILISSDRRGGGFLLIDLSRRPRALGARVLPLAGCNRIADVTPCVAVQSAHWSGGAVCCRANADEGPRPASYLLALLPQEEAQHVHEIPWSESAMMIWKGVASAPLTDRTFVYVPCLGTEDKQPRIAVVSRDRFTTYPTPCPVNPALSIFLCRDIIVLGDSGSPVNIWPFSNRSERAAPYATHDEVLMPVVTRPLIIGDRLFMQGGDWLSCYHLQVKKNEAAV